MTTTRFRLASSQNLAGKRQSRVEGIPIFVITDKGQGGSQLRLEMKPFGVVAKDDEAYKWVYSLGYNEDENGGRTWVLLQLR